MKPLPIATAIIVLTIPACALQAPPGPIAPPAQTPPQTGRAYSEASGSGSGPQVSGKFGDLAITVVGLRSAPSQLEPNRSNLVVDVTAINTGSEAVCAYPTVTLETSVGLKYVAVGAGALRISEMLPREVSRGSYSFDIKNGVKPQALVFDVGPLRDIRCGTAHYDGLIPQEVRLDIHSFPIATRSAARHAPSAGARERGIPSANRAAAPEDTTGMNALWAWLGAYGLLAILSGLLILTILYFVPSIIAFQRKKASKGAILAMNIFLGWTFIGWVAALIWALKTEVVDTVAASQLIR